MCVFHALKQRKSQQLSSPSQSASAINGISSIVLNNCKVQSLSERRSNELWCGEKAVCMWKLEVSAELSIAGWVGVLVAGVPTECTGQWEGTTMPSDGVPQCHIYTYIKHLQGWWLQHLPGQSGKLFWHKIWTWDLFCQTAPEWFSCWLLQKGVGEFTFWITYTRTVKELALAAVTSVERASSNLRKPGAQQHVHLVRLGAVCLGQSQADYSRR